METRSHRALGIGSLLAVAAALWIGGSAARADVLTDWNIIMDVEAGLIRPSAHGGSRGRAMVQGAVYDAVNSIDGGYQPYLLDVDVVSAAPGASLDAAIATAAHHVLVGIVAPARVVGLDTSYDNTLAAIPAGTAKDEGIRAGAAAAAAMLNARVGDGYRAPFTFALGTEPGDWRPTTPTALDPDPWVGNLRPFLIESSSQFRTEGPNPLTSAAYAEEFNEVKELGSLTSTTRTPDQTRAAIFWQTGFVNRLVRDLSAAHALDVVDEARLLAMVNLAYADAAISCWNDKYYWSFWRPLEAIREADTDGNPATVSDLTWLPLFDPSTPTAPPLSNPPFPDHPSGHGCVNGASFNVLRDFFGTDKLSFDVYSTRFPGQPRHFDRVSIVLREIIDARVWGGIHFRTADVNGTVIGKKVAHWVRTHYFQPVE